MRKKQHEVKVIPSTNGAMTLRDWFAGQALIGILGARSGFLVDVGTDNAPSWAYRTADAMLKARDEENQ